MSKPTTSFWVTPIYVLVPVWLGGRGDRPGFPIGRNRICIYVPQSPCVNPMDELLSASNGQRAGAVAPSTKAIGSLLQGGGAIRPPP